MKTTWLKGITDEQDIYDIRSTYLSSLVIRKRLIEILEAKIREAERASMASDGYDCANWAYRQADSQGYKRALSEIISLINEK